MYHAVLPVLEEGTDWVKVTIQRRIAKPEVIQFGVLAQTEGMTAKELSSALETTGAEELAVWLGRLQKLALVHRTGRTQGTRYFVAPTLLRGADLKIPTTLLRIEPHRLLELVRQDLQRYPDSKIGEINRRIGQEINRSQLKRALEKLISNSQVVREGERKSTRYRLLEQK